MWLTLAEYMEGLTLLTQLFFQIRFPGRTNIGCELRCLNLFVFISFSRNILFILTLAFMGTIYAHLIYHEGGYGEC